jgi:hypothetical protein
LVAGLSLAGQLVFLFGLPLVERVRFVPDDSFFFLRVAERLWTDGEFTFGGGVQTYGFQPLWQLLLALLERATGGGAALLAAAFTACAVLHVAAGAVLAGLGRRMWGSAGMAAALVAWTCNPAIMVWCWGLKENALYALLLAAALSALHALVRDGGGKRRAVWFGVLLGLMVFARVNALLVALGLLVAWACAVHGALPWRRRLRGVALAATVAALVAAPWFVFAHVHFGTAMPTSGSWKMALMRAHVEQLHGLVWLSSDHFLHALRHWPEQLGVTADRAFGFARGRCWCSEPSVLSAGSCREAGGRVRGRRGSCWRARCSPPPARRT